MSYLRYLCLFVHGGVFALFVFVLCTPMLPVSLDCPFVIALSVLSYVYLQTFLMSFFRLGFSGMLQGNIERPRPSIFDHHNVILIYMIRDL
jgi:hypothetical protein